VPISVVEFGDGTSVPVPNPGRGLVTVAVEELKALTNTTVVDARGTSCPGPILAAKKAARSVSSGAVMEVLATDSGTLKDLPAWSKKMGHEYLGHFEDAGSLRLFIRMK
jgi:tRNA 2-thiouridine synthesizing protein A